VKAGDGGAEWASARRRGARIHCNVLVVYRETAAVNADVEAVWKCSGGGSEAAVRSHSLCACPSRRRSSQAAKSLRGKRAQGRVWCGERHREGTLQHVTLGASARGLSSLPSSGCIFTFTCFHLHVRLHVLFHVHFHMYLYVCLHLRLRQYLQCN
jgi:hypothetical protein